MAKLTKEDFVDYEDGDYTAHGHPHWICIRLAARDGYNVRVTSSDWYDEELGRGTTVDSASGFETHDEALQWGVDCVNEIPLRIACAALEQAFAELASVLEHVLPAIERERAEAVAAERSAIRAQIARKAHWRGVVGDHAAREALGDLDAWIANAAG